MKLVFATHNKNKFEEVKAMMPSYIELWDLHAIGCVAEIPETADTISGNALLKARYVRDRFGYNCFADDTGLEITALDDAPGVYSARYAGPEKNDSANMDKVLANLKGKNDRAARFKTVMALCLNGAEEIFEGICEGRIIDEPRGNMGFGYDPIFQPDGEQRTFAEMSQEEKGQVSHRARALDKLCAFLRDRE
jgi:XTP/dITP diphosphohydrolase